MPWSSITDARFERDPVDVADIVVRGFKKGFGAPTRAHLRLSVRFAPRPVYVLLPYVVTP